MQLQPHLTHPFPESRQHLSGLGLADAVHHRVIHIPLKPDAGKLPNHPGIKRVVQKQVGEYGRNRGALRGSLVPDLQRSVIC